jgi:hypothetical protein
VITSLTLINVADRAWIERRTGHDVRRDFAVPPPVWATSAGRPHGGRGEVKKDRREVKRGEKAEEKR